MKLWLECLARALGLPLRLALILPLLLAAVLAHRGAGPVAAASPSADRELRLVMVEELGCRYCLKFHAEIGAAYPNSAEGQFAPLHRVMRNAPEVQGLKPVVYTPTFLLMRGREEVGRLTGYPGQDYFWDELRQILTPAGFAARPASEP